MLGGLISAGASLLGGMEANSARGKEAQTNREFQEYMSNTSYRRGMADMKAAGLNPMLAFSQGGASVPSGSMATFENPYLSAAQAYASATSAGAAAQQAETASSIGDETVMKIKQEISNLKSTEEQVKAVTQNLGVEYQNLIKHGYNLTEVGNQLRAAVDKIRVEIPLINSQQFLTEAQAQLSKAQTGKTQSENTLLGLDISAASSLDNLGREAGQLLPILKILVDVLQSSRR